MNVRFVKSMAIAVVLLMIVSALAVITPAAATDAAESADSGKTVDQRMIVQEDATLPVLDHTSSDKNVKITIETSDIAALNDLLVLHGVEPTKRKALPILNTVTLTVPASLVGEIQKLPTVKNVVQTLMPMRIDNPGDDISLRMDLVPGRNDVYTVDEHKATNAWAMGYDGSGVNIAIIDSGVDFGHPDLMGRQAREPNPGPYNGWPLVFDVASIDAFENSGTTDGTWYANTSTIVQKLGDFVYYDGYRYNVSNIPAFMNVYRIGYHPDPNLADYYGEPVAVLVPLNATSINFDTVYVDLLNDKTFNNDKPCYKGNEVSYFDAYDESADTWNETMWNSGDGIPDISGGMIYWIADGANPVPLTTLFYPGTISNWGALVAFSGEFLPGDSHGTGCAGSAVGTGATLDGMLAGMAPGASIITVPTYNSADTTQLWVATVLGYDGAPGTGDEANIASNSYGYDSLVTTSGLDMYSAWNFLIASFVPSTIWCWSTGNGGPGYGTANAITNPLGVQVGAASSMGYRYPTGSAATEDEMYGDVIPFSDHGPTKSGKLDTDVIAAGAWGLTPAPMYTMLDYPDGNYTWMIFGGTSMSCPVTAGALAMVYQAYEDAHGFFPTSATAKSLLMSGADDVNHDVLKQGAGFINVERSVKLAANIDGISIMPGIFTDDVEDGIKWTRADYNGLSDIWHVTKRDSMSGQYSWWVGQEGSGDYATGSRVHTAIVSPVMDINGTQVPHLMFDERYVTEGGFDHCMVEISTDGGAGWTNLLDRTGNSGGWVSRDVDISAYKSPTVVIRYRFDTIDAFANGFEGWYIDDVMIVDTAKTWSERSENVWYPGGYLGVDYLLFPNIVYPGDTASKTFLIQNHDLVSAKNVAITDAMFAKVSTTELTYTTVDSSSFFINITGDVTPGTQLLRITAYCSYDGAFDPGRTYSPVFNYGLELQNWIDLDSDGMATSSEFNRVTVDGGVSNILQVTMHDPLSRITDGLYLRMRNYYGGDAGIEWHFTLDCYNKSDWSWIQNTVVPTINVPANTTVSQSINMSIPANAAIGTYEGALYLDDGYNVTVVPVLVHVAADGPEFEFGGNLMDSPIYDNNVSGVADRAWRYEVGDWRVFYMNVSSSVVINPGDKLYVTVNWSDVPTDIDVHMLQPAGGGMFDQPYTLYRSSGSEELYLGAGTFGYKTTTEGAKEVVGVNFDNGLNAIALRNPIGAGLKPYEQITGYTKIFRDGLSALWPNSFVIDLNIPAVEPKGSFPVQFTTGSLSGMTSVPFGTLSFGPVGGLAWTGLWTNQGLYTDTYFELTDDYDYMKVMTKSPVPGLDIDLEVYWWDPSMMGWVLVGISAGASASEVAMVPFPVAGDYVAAVFGYTVPGGTQQYDLSVEWPMSGAAPFEVSGAPATVDPFTTYSFNVSYDLPYIAGLYQGYVGFGFLGSNDTFRVPIGIDLIDMGVPILDPVSPMPDEVIGDSTPTIEVHFDDSAAYSGLDPGSVAMFIDGTFWMPDVSGDTLSLSVLFVLPDGAHTVDVYAADKAGNWADALSYTFYVKTDTIVSMYVTPIESPTKAASAVVAGVIEASGTVTVNGNPVTVTGGTFSTTVALAEGSNTITVVGMDASNNTATAVLLVERDTTAPAVTIDDPLDGSDSSAATVNVTVTSEAGATVVINGVSATPVMGTHFVATITLQEGWNTIVAVSSDALGNSATASIDVEYVPPVYVTPPELQDMEDDLNQDINDLGAKLNDSTMMLMIGLVGILAALLVAILLVHRSLNAKILSMTKGAPPAMGGAEAQAVKAGIGVEPAEKERRERKVKDRGQNPPEPPAPPEEKL